MHSNVNIAYELAETRTLLSTVLSLQPRDVTPAGGGGKPSSALVARTQQSIGVELAQLQHRQRVFTVREVGGTFWPRS